MVRELKYISGVEPGPRDPAAEAPERAPLPKCAAQSVREIMAENSRLRAENAMLRSRLALLEEGFGSDRGGR